MRERESSIGVSIWYDIEPERSEKVWMLTGVRQRGKIKHRAGAVTAQTVMHCANVKIRKHIQRYQTHTHRGTVSLSFYFDILFSLSTVWAFSLICMLSLKYIVGENRICVLHLEYSEQAYRLNNKHQCDWVSFLFFLTISEWISIQMCKKTKINNKIQTIFKSIPWNNVPHRPENHQRKDDDNDDWFWQRSN